MASGPPPIAIQNTENDASSTLSWEGDKMFHIYIHDYCNKRGYTKTARELVLEAEIPQDSQPPINAKQGLLFEWWSVFWTLFTAKNNKQGPDEALIYTQHQEIQNALRQQTRNQQQQQQQPMNRMMNVNVNGIPRQPMPPNGQIPNGAAGIPVSQMPNGVQGHMGFPMHNPAGHPPNGVSSGGPSQPHMSQMMPGRPMGGPAGQQNPQGMGQMGPGQHAPQMNRNMLPPNGPPNMGNAMSSAQQVHSPGFQMGRSLSRPGTPGSQNMIPNPSPSMPSRVPPNNMGAQMIDVQGELQRIPAALLSQLRQDAGLGDKDIGSLTPDEKIRLVTVFRRRKPQNQQGSGVAGPSSTPSMQPASLRNPVQQVRSSKRNSTSPAEEQESANRLESSPPDRKRPRPSPIGEHALPPGQHPQQQQQPQQLQQPQPPPMAPMAPFNHQGGPGPQSLSNGMMRPGGAPMNFPNQQQGGMGMSMNQGMVQMGSPGMMNHNVSNLMNAQIPQLQNYRQSMHQLHKNHIPQGPLNPLIPGNSGSPQSNAQQVQQSGGAHPFGSGNMNPNVSKQSVASMMPPPPSPGMNKAQQSNAGKDGSGNPEASNRQESSPQIHAMGQPNQGGSSQQQQQQSGQQSAGPGTAPQTPVSNPSNGLATDPQQTGGGVDSVFNSDFLRDMVTTFEGGGFLSSEGGDINFERDFGQWFNPDDMPLDLK